MCCRGVGGRVTQRLEAGSDLRNVGERVQQIAARPRQPNRSHLGPGRARDRYMFKFGWLTITADDLVVWQAYPNAAFTLIRTTAPASPETEERPLGEEFRLGTFEIRVHSNYSESEQ
jgi:hypothetical protein